MVSGLLIELAFRLPPRSDAPQVGERIGRVVGLWSVVEAILIFLTIRLSLRTKRPQLIAPTIAIIVGLHFIPLAISFPEPRYFAAAVALVVVGAGGYYIEPQYRRTFVGTGAALALWATAAAFLLSV